MRNFFNTNSLLGRTVITLTVVAALAFAIQVAQAVHSLTA